MNPPVVNDYISYSPQKQRRCRGRRNNILVRTVLNVKLCELEDEVREVFSSSLRKDLNGLVESVSGKRRFLVRFCENNMTSNQLNGLTVDRIPVTREDKLPTISTKTEEAVNF